jgi:hypothetical protein
MTLSEWYGLHEQIIAENQAGADTIPEEWDGVHEQWTGEHEAGANTQPVHELFSVWDAEQRCFVWAIREIIPPLLVG